MKKIFLNDDDATSQQPNRRLSDSDYDCYVEEYFQELLTFERKRTERSGRPFLVMTLDFIGIRNQQSRHESVKGAMALLDLIQETDIICQTVTTDDNIYPDGGFL